MENDSLAHEREQKLEHLQQAGIESAIEREAKKRGLPYVNIVTNPRILSHDVLALIPKDEAERARLIPLAKQHTNLKIGVVETENAETKRVIKSFEEQGFVVTAALISLPSFTRALEEYMHIPAQREVIGDTLTIPSDTAHPSSLTTLKGALPALAQQSTSALLEALHSTGLELGASDIHIEPKDSGARIRFRLDGILEDVGDVSHDIYARLLSRIKVIAHIPLNVTTVAHDGRFTVSRMGNEAEIRVSVLPSPGGEYVVLRLLNPSAVALKVDDLGLEEDLWNTLKPQLEKPNGIILNTGPTGSGKTTTLYAFLSHLHSPEIKIITLENPIEYHLEGVSQTQIETDKGYGFADGVRAALRHDPDIMLIGEIRDSETAEAALHAALTGHLVFSTLHTNDAAGAVPRFLDLNTKPAILASALRVIIAQRLVRRLCETCKKPLTGSDYESSLARITAALEPHPKLNELIEKKPPLYRAEGCDGCSKTGYRGRVGIFEMLIVSDEIEELISSSPTHHDVQKYAQEHGFQSMYINGLRKVLRGITTLTEVERVTDNA